MAAGWMQVVQANVLPRTPRLVGRQPAAACMQCHAMGTAICNKRRATLGPVGGWCPLTQPCTASRPAACLQERRCGQKHCAFRGPPPPPAPLPPPGSASRPRHLHVSAHHAHTHNTTAHTTACNLPSPQPSLTFWSCFSCDAASYLARRTCGSRRGTGGVGGWGGGESGRAVGRAGSTCEPATLYPRAPPPRRLCSPATCMRHGPQPSTPSQAIVVGPCPWFRAAQSARRPYHPDSHPFVLWPPPCAPLLHWH